MPRAKIKKVIESTVTKVIMYYVRCFLEGAMYGSGFVAGALAFWLLFWPSHLV